MCKVINLFGGPGIGKSTTAAGLFHLMKRAGYKVELVTEYAKDLTYEGRNNILEEDQLYILAHQNRRMARLKNSVDYIITDSPLFLSIIYQNYFKMKDIGLNQVILNLMNEYDNINIVLERNEKEHPFQEYGRNQNQDEAKKLDEAIITELTDYNIDYTVFDSPRDEITNKIFEFIKNYDFIRIKESSDTDIYNWFYDCCLECGMGLI
jgi:hypothetical protein